MENTEHLNGSRPPVRVGLLLNSYQVNFSYYHIIDALQQSGYAQINLVVLNKKKKKITAGKIFGNLGSLFFHAYQKADSLIFKSIHNVLHPVNSLQLLENVPVIEVDPVTHNYFQQISPADLEKIKNHKIDVFIRMGFKILKGDILKSSRYGIWSYHHADNKINRGGPPGFWEMYENNPVTGTIVQVLSEDLDNGKVLSRTIGATHKFSLNRSRNSMYAKGMFLIPRLIQKLYREGDAFLNNTDEFPACYSNRLYTTPTNIQVTGFLLRMLPASFSKFIRQLFFRNQWYLLYSISKNNLPQTSMRKLKKLQPPKGVFWADPHVIFREGTYYIFLEEKEFKNKKAHISVITLDETGKYSKAVKVLERPYHLSYPFVFSYNGSEYMIPETSAVKTIELYRCEEFPLKWVPERVLMEGVNAVDCTLHQHNGRWWMFVNQAAHPAVSNNDELHIYFAESPFGPWQPHKNNPVISDARSARPAGKIFNYKSRYYRPSQDCSVTYGYGIRINEIIELTEDNYSEKEVDFIEPLWDPSIKGVHSFVYENKLTMIDGFRKVPRWY